MQKKLWFLSIVLMVFVGVGCGSKSVSRIDIDTQMDLSGKWNDTDSRKVSEEMISDCLSRPWLGRFQEEKGAPPTVIVGSVRNQTDEHIISETFTKDLERAFINSGQLRVVASRDEREEVRQERMDMQGWSSEESVKEFMQEVGADYMLTGAVNSIRDREGKKQVIFYQINLELIDLETNMKTWIGDTKIKKYIKN